MRILTGVSLGVGRARPSTAEARMQSSMLPCGAQLGLYEVSSCVFRSSHPHYLPRWGMGAWHCPHGLATWRAERRRDGAPFPRPPAPPPSRLFARKQGQDHRKPSFSEALLCAEARRRHQPADCARAPAGRSGTRQEVRRAGGGVQSRRWPSGGSSRGTSERGQLIFRRLASLMARTWQPPTGCGSERTRAGNGRTEHTV